MQKDKDTSAISDVADPASTTESYIICVSQPLLLDCLHPCEDGQVQGTKLTWGTSAYFHPTVSSNSRFCTSM